MNVSGITKILSGISGAAGFIAREYAPQLTWDQQRGGALGARGFSV